jgi:CubicO group peptidase (beta-lactamase class C family)
MNVAGLESFVFDKMSATRLPGLSLALLKDDQVVYARGFGQADIARGRAATPHTLYGSASLTKSLTAIAILQLAEKGLLKLDDPVERFVESPIKSRRGAVRIEHLLAHTSGPPALGYIEGVLRHAHQIGGCTLPIASARDVMTFAHGGDAWAEAAPGERWFYLNEGYVLLGEMVAKLSGMSWEQYVREHILQPLEMSRSFFAEDDVIRDGDWAVPYVLPRGGGEARSGRYLYGTMGADAALMTNVLDLARYLTMFLHRGRGVMSEKSFEEMIRPRIPLPTQPLPQLWSDEPSPSAARPAQYALGLTVADDFFGEPLIGHSGSLIVATSHMAFLPRSKLAVAVLCNGNGYPMSQLAKVALAIALGREPEDLPFVRSENLLTELSGIYETYRGTLRIKITPEGDLLRMEYLCGDQPPGPVTLVPERLAGDEPRFFTYCDGGRLTAQFRKVSGGGVELIYERYKFKRTGPAD